MKKNLLLRNKTIFQILVTNCFSGFVFLPMRNHLIACLVFCLVMVFLLRFLGLKIYFRSPSGLDQLFSYFRAHCENKKKKKKSIPYMHLLKAFIVQHGLNLKLFVLKSKTEVMKLICSMIKNINIRLTKTVKY